MKTFVLNNAKSVSTGESVHVLVKEGYIKMVSKTPILPSDNTPVIDAQGKLLLPGLCDMHATFGNKWNGHRETIKSGSEAAINGGVTSVVVMPDTTPCVDNASIVRSLQDLMEGSRISLEITGCITENSDGSQQASYGNLAAMGIKLLTDGVSVPQNYLMLRRAMQYAESMNVTFAMRGDIASMTSHAIVQESSTSYNLGLPAAPACAEQMGVACILSLAKETGAKLHVQCLSSALAVQEFKTHKKEGEFTSEVALHHLLFTHNDIGDLDTNMKTIPFLREEEDRMALIQAVNEGVIDCIVSDHMPCTIFEKLQDFSSAPYGMISLDTFLPTIYDKLVLPGLMSWETVIKATSTNPRQIMGLPKVSLTKGAIADFIILDTDDYTDVTSDFLKSKSRNTPWLNTRLKSKVCLVCKEEILKNTL